MENVFYICVTLLLTIGLVQSAVPTEPLCANKACSATEACRVLETCTSPGACSLQAVCLTQQDSDYLGGGCQFAEPLLIPASDGSGYDLDSCYGGNECPEGFYCSTALQDVATRCCRSDSVSPPNNGTCPAPNTEKTYFCVDECLTDADCWMQGAKCCQNSVDCTKKHCTMPEPCSTIACQEGYECAVSPDFQAICLPKPPTGSVMPPFVQPPGPGLLLSATSVAQTLCQSNNRCNPATEVCRVVENCQPGLSACTYEEICLARRLSDFHDGGCEPSHALLVRTGNGFGVRTCGTRIPCGEGTYCSARLMDVASRCCVASTDSTPRPGTCPAVQSWDTMFCVDECLSDNDCSGEYKCCQKSTQCAKKVCTRPNLPVCQLTDCPAGTKCEEINGQAECVRLSRDVATPIPPNNLAMMTCPYPYGPYSDWECNLQNQCGHGNGWNCRRGLVCCATTDCGNICRYPVNHAQFKQTARRWQWW